MKLNTIFKNQLERDEAIGHIERLKDNSDWQFMVEKILMSDIADLTEALVNPNKIWSEKEEQEAKRNRAYQIYMSKLPEALIEALTESKTEGTNYDPYESLGVQR